ncbi:MAG: phosphatase PAP2 family protein [Sedimentisphaerales bacterium]
MKKLISRLKSNRFDSIVFISALVLLIAALFSFLFIDKEISRWVSSRSADLDNFEGSDLLKSLGKVYVPLWLLFLWGYAKKNLQLILAASLSVLMALAITGPLKLVTKRERPREIYMQPTFTPQGQRIVSNSDNESFPSSDTAMVFAHAVVVTPLLSGLSLPVLYVLAAAVGILRILAMAHYPWRPAVTIAFFVIPLLTFFAGGKYSLLVFFGASAVLAGFLYFINKVSLLLQQKKLLTGNSSK